MHNQNGLTLIELLVVIVIMGVTFILAVPTFLDYRYTINVNAAARWVAMDIQMARVMAISENVNCCLEFDTVNSLYNFRKSNSSSASCTALSTLVKTVNLPSGIIFNMDTAIQGPNNTGTEADGVTFNGNIATLNNKGGGEAGTVYLVPQKDVNVSHDRRRAVRILSTTTAHVKVYKYDASVTPPWSTF